MMTQPSPIQNEARKHETAIAESTAEPQTNYEPAAKKRSLDYIVKSGMAGGLAGCAVSKIFIVSEQIY